MYLNNEFGIVGICLRAISYSWSLTLQVNFENDFMKCFHTRTISVIHTHICNWGPGGSWRLRCFEVNSMKPLQNKHSHFFFLLIASNSIHIIDGIISFEQHCNEPHISMGQNYWKSSHGSYELRVVLFLCLLFILQP